MYPIRIWPTVAPVIRSCVGGRAEIINTVKSYGHNTPVPQPNPPWNFSFFGSQQNRYQTDYSSSASIGLTSASLGVSKKIGLQSLTLPFTTSSTNFTQDFQHNENDHAHEVMRSLPAYFASTIDLDGIEDALPPTDTINCPPPLPNTDWSPVSPHSIAGSFIALSKECKKRPMDLTSAEHASLSAAVSTNVRNLSNDQLRYVLGALTLWPQSANPTSANFRQIWNAVDEECTRRVKQWDLQQSFVVADLWYRLRLSRIGGYTRAMLVSLSFRLETLKPHELVQYLFHINLCRESPANVNILLLEKSLSKVIDNLTLEELGVVAMGLFKTQSFIKSDQLADAIFDKILSSDLSVMSNISLASVMKLLRKSAQTKRVDKVYKVLDSVLPFLSERSQQSLVHVALLGTNTLVFNAKVISGIVENFAENPATLRLKDIERIVFALMLYNYIPENQTNILEIFAQELRQPHRHAEISRYPKSFISCINYMACMGFLPSDLVSVALQPSMLKSMNKIQNYSDIGREVMELDCILEIEGSAAYKGNRLNPKHRTELMTSYYMRYRQPCVAVASKGIAPAATHQERLIVEVTSKLEALLGGEEGSTCTNFVLPFVSTPDIIFCTTRDGAPVALPQEYFNQAALANKYPVGEGLQYTAVVVGGRNSYVRGTQRVRGQLQMKIRHLKKLGYNVALVSFMEYSKRNLRHKLTVLDDSLVKCGAVPAATDRVFAAHSIIKAREAGNEDCGSVGHTG